MATIVITPSYGETFSPRNLNMWHVSTFMDTAGLPVVFMKRKRNGDILIKTTKFPDEKVLNTKNINDVPVKIELPDNLNTITGRFYHPEVPYMEVEQIHRMLRKGGETHWQIVKIGNNSTAVHISWYTIEKRELPDSVCLGWDRVKIVPLKPRPVRCYHCQSYGHIAADCTKPSVCANCSGDHEIDYNCTRPPKCPACDGQHTAFDPQCPAWLEESEVVQIKKREKISYHDALKKREENKKEERQQQEKKIQVEEELEDSDSQEEEIDVEDTEEKKTEEAEEEEKKIEEEETKTDDTKKEQQPQTEHSGWQQVIRKNKKRKT